MQDFFIPILGPFFSLPREQANIATFRTTIFQLLMTLSGPFSNPVLPVVSIDRFPFDNNKNLLAPQPKMLGESESLQIRKISDKILKIKKREIFLINFGLNSTSQFLLYLWIMETYCKYHLYPSIHIFFIYDRQNIISNFPQFY